MCIRKSAENEQVIPLPYTYMSPCINGMFNELFYWDTYYTNLGLLLISMNDMAENNVNNLLYEIEQFGYAPNCNHKHLFNRSQPPYMSQMILQIYGVTQDRDWLAHAYNIVYKEYDSFWMTERTTPIGLNRHFHSATNEELLEFYNEILSRLPLKAQTREEKIHIASHYLAEAETGWDFNPRFNKRCADFAPVDLNANLFMYESDLLYINALLGGADGELWLNRMQSRKMIMNRYMWNEEKGLYFDYDFVNGRQSEVASLATFHPLWAKIANHAQARKIRDNLSLFEYDYGLSACQKQKNEGIYQWDYPNGWAPLQYIAVEGLNNYGYTEDAKRISIKYLDVVLKNFQQTFGIWEKYNVLDGSLEVTDEYKSPELMDWSAGVFLHFLNSLDKKTATRL